MTARAPTIPLGDVAGRWLATLADATRSPAIAALDGATLLGERGMLAALRIPGRVSAGGGCTLFRARGGAVALNLARPDDRSLLPALFAASLDPDDPSAIAALVADRDAAALVARGREMGLAIATDRGDATAPAANVLLAAGSTLPDRAARGPRVLDLAALWAGPLAAHLLWIAGADVVKVESRARPDAMRDGDAALHALLNHGKASVVLDFGTLDGRRALLALIARADIVIEAARPRALAQLGIDAGEIVRATPGLVWLTITGHGTAGEAANWVGFGDDTGVAGGLTAALHAATGRLGFVGDAIADPLTGIHAARVAWEAWSAGRGGRYGIAMRGVAAQALDEAAHADRRGLTEALRAWSAARGQPFPRVCRRPVGAPAARGADTQARLAGLAPC